ncbi:hypothetical protein PHET_08268 [Paragonimus heterotremus]|uniref:Uncharacterized protein n=1 Tax=Paragonimus heterotremus TaxID=100268 RepID=A0A8J4T512_9TREM|nr:hypothetical protein PHET_08268 [Paragonimus heterotremus]
MREMVVVAAKALVEATDVLLRVPFWLFLDLLLASRLDGIYDFISRHPKEVKRVCPDCQVLFDERFVPFIIAGSEDLDTAREVGSRMPSRTDLRWVS